MQKESIVAVYYTVNEMLQFCFYIQVLFQQLYVETWRDIRLNFSTISYYVTFEILEVIYILRLSLNTDGYICAVRQQYGITEKNQFAWPTSTDKSKVYLNSQ